MTTLATSQEGAMMIDRTIPHLAVPLPPRPRNGYRDALLPAVLPATLATLAGLQRRVAELEAELAAVRAEADHDPLTGLLNRRGLTAAWRGACWPGWLALLDLDRFKEVNDRYGHAAGDAVLVAVADQLRGLPLATRLGGDEFCVVAAAELLPTRVSVVLPGPGRQTVWVTVSVGLTPAAGDLSAALGRADTAMYRAKLTGRASTELDPDQPERPITHRPRVRLRQLRGRDVPARPDDIAALVDVVQAPTLTRSDTTMNRTTPPPAPSRVAALHGSRIAHALAGGREIRRAAVRQAAETHTPAGVTR
jgi:diguanylate cyclase (GGDEF)-like protein